MSGTHILVVDDDESLRRVTQVQLEQEGYTVATAKDGEQALAAVEKSPQDLVLTDMKMPGMSGVELLRQLRARFPELPVILVTAFSSVESADEAKKLGAYDYITKPVDPNALRLIVRRALVQREWKEPAF